MPDNHKTLEAYIQKLLSIKDKLREDDLRSIAAEMGFTEHEWNLLQDECEDHLQRGEGFAQYENWDDAIVELNQALAINPLHHEVLDQLSIAHYRRYLERQRPNDKLLSIQYAEKILDDDPGHKPSLQRISALKKGAVVSSPRKTPAKSSPRTAYIALFIGLALAMMGGLLTFLFVSVEPELPSGTDTPEVATVPESSPASSSPAGSEAAISLLKHPQGKHFALTTDVAELNPYIDSYSFKYRGFARSKGPGSE
jgi:tetratricopeptide (TPR) repeat protein